MLALLLVACQADLPAVSTAPAAPAATDCGALSTPEARDRCRAEALAAMPPTRWLEVEAAAAAIEDPIRRGAALFSWIRAHQAELPQEAAAPLCGALSAGEEKACLRRFQASHLNR